jgi:phosphoribosylcarboxyaminoimidazole (NCAIR) mutase
MAIGKAGAINAAIYAAQILGANRPELRTRLQKLRADRAKAVQSETLD